MTRILTNIEDLKTRERPTDLWRDRIHALKSHGKDEDADAIKAWLRSQYADNIRERKAGASPQDFDLIGTEFHRWVHDHEEKLQLLNSGSFDRFIEKYFSFYTSQYLRIRHAADNITLGLECIGAIAGREFRN